MGSLSALPCLLGARARRAPATTNHDNDGQRRAAPPSLGSSPSSLAPATLPPSSPPPTTTTTTAAATTKLGAGPYFAGALPLSAGWRAFEVEARTASQPASLPGLLAGVSFLRLKRLHNDDGDGDDSAGSRWLFWGRR